MSAVHEGAAQALGLVHTDNTARDAWGSPAGSTGQNAITTSRFDRGGNVVAKRRIGTGVEGFAELLAAVAEHSEQPEDVAVAIETDKGVLVAALQAAGFTVYGINPRAV